MRFTGSALARLRKNKLTKFYNVRMQTRKGDWGAAVHNGELHWDHIKHTRDDLHMLIDLERVEWYHARAHNAMKYFQRLVMIADQADLHPNYSEEMLAWWLGKGGIPGSYLHHKKHDEIPLSKSVGIERKFKDVIMPRLKEINGIKNPTRMQRLGIYTNLESLYQGYGYAAGLHSDPESMRTAAFDFQTPMTVIEIKGNDYPSLPLPQADPRTLENQLLASLRADGQSFHMNGKRYKYDDSKINCISLKHD